jgi:hypothetical protein
MSYSTVDSGQASISQGTGRMALVLVLALVVNLALLAAPLIFGSRGDQVVAASPQQTTVAPPTRKLPAKTATTPKAKSPPVQPVEQPAEPVVETIVGDEPTDAVQIVNSQPSDLIARVESPAPIEIPDIGEPLTPATPDLASGLPAEIVFDYPVDFSPLPPPAPMPDFDPCLLEITNPPETNGPVHFVIEGEVQTLLPGETRQWTAFSQRLVEFHRGEDFGDARCTVDRGTWRFQVSEDGWELVAAEHVSMMTP